MDTVSKQRRSANMAAIRSKDTKPELVVRKFLFRNGLRYRLHAETLPGKPDIIFPRTRLVIFVHGCFWHGCPRCIDGTRRVKSNTQYWSEKLAGNRARDARNLASLKATGWKAIVVWECEITRSGQLQKLLRQIRTREANSIRSARLKRNNTFDLEENRGKRPINRRHELRPSTSTG